MSSWFLIIPESLYTGLFYTIVFLLCMSLCVRYANSNGNSIVEKSKTQPMGVFLLFAIVALYIGFRPLQYDFGDTYMYAHSYNNVINSYEPVNWHTEWLWDDMAYFMKSLGFSVNSYFLVIALLYVGLMLVCCLNLFPNNAWIALLFFLASFSFWGYGVNGLRNGLSTSILLLSVTLIVRKKTANKLWACLLMLLAIAIHRTSLLPAACVIAAVAAVKEPKMAIRFWLFSIVLSLVAGIFISGVFSGLGFDERMTRYAQATDAETMSEFSHTGFRWDFLLYSAMPIWLTWYVTVKRNIKDRTFNIIAVTYILVNSFWIMVIRSSFSNRFAYLSWFLYPLVIAYPLLKFHIWKEQDKKISKILLAYSGFTYFMFLIGK